MKALILLTYGCPCSGFALGETGVLDLVRLRQCREYDRMKLNPLFKAFDQNPLVRIKGK